MRTEIINIKKLVNTRVENKLLSGKELADLPNLDDAYLLIEDGVITDYGSMKELPAEFKHSPSVMQPDNLYYLPGVIVIHILFLQQVGKKSL